MVKLDVFDNLGPFWAHLDTFGPFQTKINLLPHKDKVEGSRRAQKDGGSDEGGEERQIFSKHTLCVIFQCISFRNKCPKKKILYLYQGNNISASYEASELCLQIAHSSPQHLTSS